MRSRHVLLNAPNEALLRALLLLLLGAHVLAVCPAMCSCSRSHRDVDCSWRGLRQLPEGLQHNLRSLNLSHNRYHNLDDQLTAYTHLRTLDVSHNRLGDLPTGLPRSLWQLFAPANRIRVLEKNDTVYQWNLRLLDLSSNKLERAVFINNTLINLRLLNLSHNHFWTLPTNIPIHLEILDVSHNSLVQVLPGSLDRLPRLTHFYLHANRFTMLPYRALDKITGLKVVTLGDNPWACHLHANITYLLSWSQHTPARILGCPCHTHPICGGARPSRSGGWHFASYNLPPLGVNTQDLSSIPPETSVTSWWYLTLLSTPYSSKESLQHPFTAAPVSISPLSPSTTGKHLKTPEHLSTAATSAMIDHMFHTDLLFTSGTKKDSPTDSLRTSDASSITDTSAITHTAVTDMTLTTDRFLTTQGPSGHTKRTTTRTRSVRRPNQSLPSGVSNAGPALTALTFIQNIGLLSVILQHVL
ncbi:oligodendrocyte-myelin glycoprotein-like [Genypterus blacodes]|uniref:oligodendrocyte-myelin glycoprotein-like n=1 Tax=Genypterus blacodes TaxID=154954 RepID=UPI003F76BC56